ncbi:ABC transporter substrate-binding protein [Myxococcus landrumensis]|uniref:ABC transporter substrate-binding protein n=1 Tax=Myxococcus landrumensis TaxID=2813577 RepID=A0ABX7NAH2_9BACT|nr:ABC transporter substrate-binding protein [Myxococcus landrumus]QSQ15780.1 ABC transporter substrate-binding protein [Myxococcus landrumus]
MLRARWFLVAVASVWLGCKKPEAAPLPADPKVAKQGRALFQRGKSVRGTPLTGFLAPERVELSGEVAACARCHGPSGRGSAEGGVAVPDISPGALGHSRTKAVGELEDRSRPAYTRDALLRAITEGLSSSGRTLGVTMPRYVLSPTEQDELLAYLEQLGEHPDPGISPTSLTVGAALPLTGRLGPIGHEAAAVVRAVFADVNASGGIFRRKLELVVEDDAAHVEAAHSDATTRLLERGVLALVASMRRGPLPSDARLTEEGAPLILPLALNGGTSDEDSPVFFLHPDEPTLARLAVQSLARAHESELRRKPLLVVHTGGDLGKAWASAARDELARRELHPPQELTLSDSPLPVDRWASEPPLAVLYSGTPEGLDTLLRGLERRALATRVFAPASLAIPQVVGRSTAHVHFLYPAGLGERAPDLEDFTAFMKRHDLRPGHTAFQLGAYAAARVLVEALTRAGAEVTRASLTQHLEALRDFDTGVSPPVTFGVNRRVGIQGAQLATLDATTGQLVAVSGWIPLSP